MKQNEAAKTVELADMNFVSAQDKTLLYSDITLENEINVASVGSTITDEALENIYAKAQVPTVRASAQNTGLSTVYKDFQPEEIAKIKQLIYNIHNEETPPDIPNYSDKSFINEFYDAETLFEYMSLVNPEITKETGVTRAQLIEFTQNDDWEDSHYDFFGSLNRIFTQLDTDGNKGVLSFDEIQAFIDKELGKDFKAYSYKVNEYTNEIQKNYEELSSQDKLVFAIDRTREYLEASGLELQLEALDRLLKQGDKHNSIHVGNIAIANLNQGNTSGDITLGSYNYWSYSFQEKHYGVTEDVVIYAGDEDSDDVDLGITLDISLLEGKWYELVNTLVHELTHATAYKFYEGFRNVKTDDGGIAIYDDGTPIYYPSATNKSILDGLKRIGALTDVEYNYCNEHWANMSSNETRTDEETEMFNILLYRAACAWGEYSAYQADADYNDSIGQDVYYQAGDNITTAVDGDREKDKITDHIENSYNHYVDEDGVEHNESTPDYKWWTYV